MALLTDTEKGILREIYEVPPSGDVVIAGDNTGYPTGFPLPTGGNNSIRQRLELAIAQLDTDVVSSTRVSAILAEYSNFDLDRSPIDKDGYSFRWQRNMAAIYKALYAYTGILIRMDSGNNQTPLG
jgi:hypothetical protein